MSKAPLPLSQIDTNSLDIMSMSSTSRPTTPGFGTNTGATSPATPGGPIVTPSGNTNGNINTLNRPNGYGSTNRTSSRISSVTPGGFATEEERYISSHSYNNNNGMSALAIDTSNGGAGGDGYDEEKEVEYQTPGAGSGAGGGGGRQDGMITIGGGDEDNNENETDTSDSSLEEMDLIRSKIVAQSIASGMTPGGPNVNIGNNINYTSNTGAGENNNKNNSHESRNSMEMGIEIANLMQEVENKKEIESKNAESEMVQKNNHDSKFKMMLNDNLFVTDIIENDIVNEMNDDLNPNSNNNHSTPGGPNASGLDEHGYGQTPGGANNGDGNDNHNQNVHNQAGEGGESYAWHD